MMLDRQQLTDIVVTRYFGALNAHDLETVMGTFAENCVMKFPGRRYMYPDKTALRTHMADFLQTFPGVWFREFNLTVDVEAQSVATNFLIDLTDHAGEITKMNNCNFFYCNDAGLFQTIIIYASGALQAGFEAGSAG